MRFQGCGFFLLLLGVIAYRFAGLTAKHLRNLHLRLHVRSHCVFVKDGRDALLGIAGAFGSVSGYAANARSGEALCVAAVLAYASAAAFLAAHAQIAAHATINLFHNPLL